MVDRKIMNLLRDYPQDLVQEWFDIIHANRHCKIERIVSKGHQSPPDFWYDQDWDEWVLILQGKTRLAFEDKSESVALSVGDCLFIAAGEKHRVAWTDPDQETIWLAVHLKTDSKNPS